MTERLHVYWYMKTDPRLKAVSPHHNQAHCYVAASTQKEACALMGIKPHDFQHYGGISGNDKLNAVMLAEPRVVFVARNNSGSLLSRWDEIDDPARIIAVDVRDRDLHGHEVEHPSFGMVTVARVSGESDLFMVDYPQGHAIILEISTAQLVKRDAGDRVHENRSVARVEMSEVQWARLLSSFNTGGVPCTLRRYRDPQTGDYLTPRDPGRHKHDEETFREAISKKASSAAEGLSQARKALEALLAGGSVRKGDLNDVLATLAQAERDFTANMPYVAEQAHEAITEMSENAKSEIDAHVDFAMQRLGERALGSRLHDALAAGVDPLSVGKTVLLALNPPRSDVVKDSDAPD
ncbi:hypothetical protein MARCHEWKA_04240 [Brevundimonas phage vB_BpoS-Marchewka]|uniref:Uncharacterized protein n=1 Tax=Brevundimonas phage vB_BpoS-Marchewka TaxID=2948604 RepID=A0A9E7N658_9CAUD|nr:hypothetical protein MARCHEWKA_04240 [Brevundimonas phage vB_BpoS-Marchewka]